jgi:hypothetical protein
MATDRLAAAAIAARQRSNRGRFAIPDLRFRRVPGVTAGFDMRRIVQ